MARTPLPMNTSSNTVVNFAVAIPDQESEQAARSPRSMRRSRACWAVHAPVGWAVMPRMCTRRVWISITNKTYRRLRNTVSTVKSAWGAGRHDEPLARQAAALYRPAGGDDALIPQWAAEGRRRAQAARQPPHGGRPV